MQRSIADKIAQIERLMAEQASHHATEMASQHVRFETALDNMVQGLCMFDSAGLVLVHNRRFDEMFADVAPGASAGEALPEALRLRADARDSWHQARSFTRMLDDGRTIAVTEKPMEGGGWVATFEDVTERYRIEERISYMARHDPLTGLPNRVLYQEHTDHILAGVAKVGGLAVLYIDLDHFKTVNDTLGHPVGDALLCAVAQRLRDETRVSDMIIRLGGDEFAIIQSSSTQRADAKVFAERLIQVLSKPFQVGEHQLLVGASIGIAITDDQRVDADTLLKRAETALYKAKEDGRNTFRFFDPDMDERMQARRRLEIDLRTAVADRQFENYYQPLVAINTREVSGFEALVRWRHPTRGIVSPGEFISLAEETGLIVEIGMQVLERACRDALDWPDHVKVAVNLSPLQFRNRGLAGEIAAVLERTGLPGTRLELELTESVLLQDSDATLKMLHEIRALGVRISMDDFGTGYSSLSYLHRFPFDKIKIDQSFIRGLNKSVDCLAIIRAVIGLGKSLGMLVVAEGVETREQLALLERETCDQVQGYLFSKPVPVEKLEHLLDRQVEFAA
jgi:diguanylate cyclase (GGDEF)-like protein